MDELQILYQEKERLLKKYRCRTIEEVIAKLEAKIDQNALIDPSAPSFY